MQLTYTESAIKLNKHLESMMLSDGYPEEPTWGYAFSLLSALEQSGDLINNQFAEKSLRHYLNQKKDDKSFSWEFTTYAIYRSSKFTRALPIIQNIVQYNEKGTRMINWTLLRQLNRTNHKKSPLKVKFLLQLIKKLYTTNNGQILDEFKTRSLQYHAFCLFILVELDQTQHHDLVKYWLIKGCEFAVDATLNDGTALYLGRGQEQIFGYGALIFALEYTARKYNVNITPTINKIWEHLNYFQRPDGSYPLVLNKKQPEAPNVTFDKNKPYGWFGYNTLYDYQPFLAYCLLRADKFKKGNFDV